MEYIHTQELSEKYMSRRTVSAHEPTDVMIRKIGFINEEEIGVLIDVAGDDFILELSNIKEDLFKFIGNIPQTMTEVDDITGEITQLYFNEDMTRCGFNKNNYIYDIKLIENANESGEEMQHILENIISISTTFFILFTMLSLMMAIVYHIKFTQLVSEEP